MFLIDLFEAPIGNIYTHGDFSQPGSLRADDLSLASSKRQEKIIRVLRKAPIAIDLHLVNLAAPVANRDGHFDISFYLKQYPERFGRYLTPEQMKDWWVPITPRQDALNLVMIENEGDNRIPMTPWIIAHRLSHAFEYAEPLLFQKIWKLFLSTLEQVVDSYGLWRMNIPGGSGSPHFALLVPIFGTTRAAREGLIKPGRAGEWYHDCFAQMCVTGDIRFNAAPEGIRGGRGDPTSVDESFAYLRTKMLRYFHEMLNNSIGKILVF